MPASFAHASASLLDQLPADQEIIRRPSCVICVKAVNNEPQFQRGEPMPLRFCASNRLTCTISLRCCGFRFVQSLAGDAHMTVEEMLG